MAEQQTIKYAPQWNNMTVDNVTFQTNNVWSSTAVAYDPFPSTDETKQCPLREFLIKFSVLNRQRPLTLDFNTFRSSNGLDYNNGKYVSHPTPEAVKKELGKIAINPSYMDKTPVLSGNYSSTEQVNSIQQLLAYCLITGTEVDIWEIIYSDLITKLLNKSRLKYVSYPIFISCSLQVLLGSNYTQDENFGFLPGILSNSNFTKDASKVTDIELMTHMIAVNNQKDSVSPLPLAAKPKKGKSQTVTLTLPKLLGPEVPGALSKKSKRPKSKKPPTKTKVTPPKPTKGLPSTLNEGTHKSKPLPENTATPPKDSGGNIQPFDRDITSTTSDEGTTKTMPRPEGSLGDKDSGETYHPANMEPIYHPVADLMRTGAKYQVDQTRSTRLRYQSLPKNKGKPSHEGDLDTQPIVLFTYADVRAFILSNDEIEEDILGAGEEMDEEPQVAGIAKTHQVSSSSLGRQASEKYEEVAVNYADLKAFVNDYYDENIAHRDQNDKLVEASMSSLDKSSNTISDLYKGLNIITELLKEIKNAVKDDSVINKKITEASESFTKFSTNIIDLQSSVNTL
ncbi:hypothetical protein Tco_1405697 [Tanacetum coccineum]